MKSPEPQIARKPERATTYRNNGNLMLVMGTILIILSLIFLEYFLSWILCVPGFIILLAGIITIVTNYRGPGEPPVVY